MARGLRGSIQELPQGESHDTRADVCFDSTIQNVNQPTIHVQFTPQSEGRRLMPDKKERDLWWAYLAGKPESDWNPPKKPKQSQNSNKRRQSSHGMRGFADDPEYDFSYDRPRQESWQTNDEGEVELVLRVDPSESLPTPTGSPAPPDTFSTQQMPGSLSIKLEHMEATTYKPREPSPSLLRHIDEVSFPRFTAFATNNFLVRKWLYTFSCISHTG
jgi:hypothetical protein